VKKPTRSGVGDAILKLGEENPRVVVVSCDLTDSTKVGTFKKKYPDRFFSVGIAEQNAASISAGLALCGFIPFFTSFAVFSVGRAYDQLRVSICYNNANVKVVGSHAGLLTGEDGASHQATEDIALTRSMPNLTVLSPSDYTEAYLLTLEAGKVRGPVYIRATRASTPVLFDDNTIREIGRSYVLKEGKDVTIFATGPIVYEALAASEELEKEGISAEVVDVPTIKPIDAETLVSSVKKTGCCVTIEEHQVHGGFGSAVCEVLAEEHPVPVKMLGLRDEFGQSGEGHQLLKFYGLTASELVKACKEVIKRK
jgi:transketolase